MVSPLRTRRTWAETVAPAGTSGSGSSRRGRDRFRRPARSRAAGRSWCSRSRPGTEPWRPQASRTATIAGWWLGMEFGRVQAWRVEISVEGWDRLSVPQPMNGIIQRYFRLADYIAGLHTGSSPVAMTVTLWSGIGSTAATVRWLTSSDAETARLPTAASTRRIARRRSLEMGRCAVGAGPGLCRDNWGIGMANLWARRLRVYIIAHGTKQ